MHIDTYSETLRRAVRMDVILPDRRGGFCPPWKTLYLLHGMTDDHSMWQRRSAIERYADEAGLAVIKPDTGLKWYTDTAWGERYFSYIADELPQIMERMLPGLSRRRADRYIAGLSMGGYGALKCVLTYPERYAGCISLSARCSVQAGKRRAGKVPCTKTGGRGTARRRMDSDSPCRARDVKDKPWSRRASLHTARA